jgi:hypothetical protein
MKKACLPVLLFCFVIALSACGNRSVYVRHGGYVPAFNDAPYEKYRGKHVAVSSVTIKDSTAWHNAYLSANKKFWYEIDSWRVGPYVLQSMQKAFKSTGMILYDEPAGNPDVLDVLIDVNSINDKAVNFTMSLKKNHRIISQEELTAGPLMSNLGKGDNAAYEKYAYSLIDGMVVKILDNPAFQKAMAPVMPIREEKQNFQHERR